jgi:heptosyltransferase-2
MENKILIIKLGAIGDVLRTTAILQGLKEKYNAKIYWLTKKDSLDILKNNNFIDNILIFDKKLTKILKNQKFELIINLDDDFEACKLASKLNSKRIIGAYLKDGKQTYTENSSQWFDLSLISKYGKEKADELKKLNKKTYLQHLYEILDINPGNIILNLKKSELDFANDFAKKNNTKNNDLVIGLNTSAGKRWQLKSLGIEKTAELADKLVEELKAKVILFGGKEEKERNQKIKQLIKSKIIDAGCDNSLLEFASIINLCDIIITSDSLALHIAVALNKKIVVFFGPTSSSEITLYGLGKKIVSYMECVCCYKKTCNTNPNCMDSISTDQIFNATKDLIQK